MCVCGLWEHFQKWNKFEWIQSILLFTSMVTSSLIKLFWTPPSQLGLQRLLSWTGCEYRELVNLVNLRRGGLRSDRCQISSLVVNKTLTCCCWSSAPVTLSPSSISYSHSIVSDWSSSVLEWLVTHYSTSEFNWNATEAEPLQTVSQRSAGFTAQFLSLVSNRKQEQQWFNVSYDKTTHHLLLLHYA